MATLTNNSVAQAEFERASNQANELAERISECGRAGVPHATMIELLKAWKIARHEARTSLERMLSSSRARTAPTAKGHWDRQPRLHCA